jgi:hypothetical protein
VSVPPLRERAEDIPLLVAHFLAIEAPQLAPRSIPQHVWEMLSAHRWPGNVRELRNAVQRLVVAPELPLPVGEASGGGPLSQPGPEIRPSCGPTSTSRSRAPETCSACSRKTSSP